MSTVRQRVSWFKLQEAKDLSQCNQKVVAVAGKRDAFSLDALAILSKASYENRQCPTSSLRTLNPRHVHVLMPTLLVLQLL